VVMGCVMMRCCHRNTCPVGVATQDPELRRFFRGRPEYLVNYMFMVAREVRELMARLGFRRFDDMIGRSDLLDMDPAIDFWKARGLDFSRILYRPDAPADAVRKTAAQRHELETAIDHQILPKVREAIEKGTPVRIEMPIRNIHRTAGTLISSHIVRRHGGKGLPADTITLHFRGSAGQSFAAFCCPGITFVLEGEANDYMGKGLSGAKVIIRPPAESKLRPEEHVIIGNVALYGATAGEVYVCGQAGERFAIRNSGAVAVVEGVGDHGCEYMTGGRVAVLGPTGVNFAAGMSGGIAYVYDPEGIFDSRCNLSMVDLESLTDPQDQQALRRMIENHVRHTGSRRGTYILENWDHCLPHFVKVFPMEYKRALGRLSREDEAVEREEPVAS